MRRAAWLFALAGCDFTFNLDHIDPIGDAAVDAFDLANCPDTYPLELSAGSRYRVLPAATAWDSHDDCRNDLDGTTHLAVPQSQTELSDLIAAMSARGDIAWWVGGVQLASATAIGADWMWLTGEPFDENLWHAGVEPNDGEGIENGTDQFTLIVGAGLADGPGMSPFPAVCECDGRAVTMAARMAVDQNRH